MKPSRLYQNYLQVVGRASEILLFTAGIYLGKEAYATALVLLALRMCAGFLTSELMYKRMQSVVREEK